MPEELEQTKDRAGILRELHEILEKEGFVSL